jgi:hypothetical protein
MDAIIPEKQTVKEANSQILLRVNVESSPKPNPSKSVHETALTLQIEWKESSICQLVSTSIGMLFSISKPMFKG